MDAISVLSRHLCIMARRMRQIAHQLVLGGSVDMVVQKDDRSSKHQEPVREPLLLDRVHLASCCAPFHLLIIRHQNVVVENANMSYMHILSW